MTHDPLCLCATHKSPHIQHLNGVCHYCQCDLIARVRADERDQAVQRVVGRFIVDRTLMIAAIRGEQP